MLKKVREQVPGSSAAVESLVSMSVVNVEVDASDLRCSRGPFQVFVQGLELFRRCCCKGHGFGPSCIWICVNSIGGSKSVTRALELFW